MDRMAHPVVRPGLLGPSSFFQRQTFEGVRRGKCRGDEGHLKRIPKMGLFNDFLGGNSMFF